LPNDVDFSAFIKDMQAWKDSLKLKISNMDDEMMDLQISKKSLKKSLDLSTKGSGDDSKLYKFQTQHQKNVCEQQLQEMYTLVSSEDSESRENILLGQNLGIHSSTEKECSQSSSTAGRSVNCSQEDCNRFQNIDNRGLLDQHKTLINKRLQDQRLDEFVLKQIRLPLSEIDSLSNRKKTVEEHRIKVGEQRNEEEDYPVKQQSIIHQFSRHSLAINSSYTSRIRQKRKDPVVANLLKTQFKVQDKEICKQRRKHPSDVDSLNL